MDKLPPRSESFLLRCWQERSPQTGLPDVWRFSLEDVRTGKRVGFATIKAVMAFVQKKLAAAGDEDSTNDEGLP